jgi:hypothetical protein
VLRPAHTSSGERALRDVTVRNNPAELRYEVLGGGELIGESRYRTEPGLAVRDPAMPT